jgi:hypothetical protein
VAGIHGLLAIFDDRLGDSQITLVASVVKINNDQLYYPDPLLGHDQSWKNQGGAFTGLLSLLLRATGGVDPLLPSRLLVFPLTIIYLLGMYFLLYRQSKSYANSTFVAVLSITVVRSLGQSFWGVGPLSTITPTGASLAFCPLLVLMFLHYLRAAGPGGLMMVFLAVGLLGNIHLQTAENLAIILLGTLLVMRRFSPRVWLLSAACLAAMGIGLFPSLLYLPGQLSSFAVTPSVSIQAIYRVLHRADMAILYPEMLRVLPQWLLRIAALAIPTVIVLSQVRRFKTLDVSFWIVFASASILVALALQGLSQVIRLAGRSSLPLLGFFEAINLVMVPVYVLFTQALTSLFRLVRSRPAMLRWACAAVMVAWMIPSDNLRVPRHFAYQAATAMMDEEDKPRRVVELDDLRQRGRELHEIAVWVKANTDKSAMLLSSHGELRLLSRRSLLAGEEDGWFLFTHDPAALPEWKDRLDKQNLLLRPLRREADLDAIGHFTEDLSRQRPFPVTSGWYVVLESAAAPQGPRQDELEIPGAWGRYYRLYRLR